MIIQRNKKNEVIIKFAGKIAPEKLQAMADFIEYIEISSKSRASEEDANKLIAQVRKGRWKSNKAKLAK